MSVLINPYSVANTILSFGWEAADSSNPTGVAQVVWTNERHASKFTNNAGGTVDVAEILFRGITAGNGGYLQLAIYSDNSGPNVLLGETNTIATTTLGDNLFTMVSPVSVANGTAIWVSARSANTITQTGGSRATNDRHYWKSVSSATAFQNPYGVPGSQFARLMNVRLREV